MTLNQRLYKHVIGMYEHFLGFMTRWCSSSLAKLFHYENIINRFTFGCGIHIKHDQTI